MDDGCDAYPCSHESCDLFLEDIALVRTEFDTDTVMTVERTSSNAHSPAALCPT